MRSARNGSSRQPSSLARTANLVLGKVPLHQTRAGRLTVPSLLNAARKQVPGRDFEDKRFIGDLTVLVTALETEAQLTPVARLAVRKSLTELLANRLRVEALIRKHPEILRQKITAPVVITGLPRTGSTLLHRMLAEDPSMRSMRTWEGLSPAPRSGRLPVDLRRLQGLAFEKGSQLMAPDLKKIHGIRANAPEEEALLLNHSFSGGLLEQWFNVPSFSKHAASRDQTHSYEYLATLLKVLQWQKPAERWVLKSPLHMQNLDCLMKVFPDAKIVQTHREPQKVLPSACSLVFATQRAFSNEITREGVGRRVMDKLDQDLKRATTAREKEPNRFLDVHYSDVVANPIEQVRQIYRFAGKPFSPDLQAKLEGFLRNNPKDKHGAHRYSLEEFGLDRDTIARRFVGYPDGFVERPGREALQ